jgi:hypothetical protein
VRRAFTLKQPKQGTPWFLAGDAATPPRIVDGRGNPVAVDLKPGSVGVPVEDRRVLVPQPGDRIGVLHAVDVPAGSTWVLRKEGAAWWVLLLLPAKMGEAKVVVDIWAPFKDDATLLKELLEK